jgi:hypothetical protein
LSSAFGDKVNNFSFNNKGILSYNGSKRDFKGKERKVFKGLKKVMDDRTVSNVIYEAQIELAGNVISANSEGGALTILASENQAILTENIILVKPDQDPTVDIATDVQVVYNAYGNPVSGNTIYKTVPNNRSVTTFHEIGHLVFDGENQSKVISYDNSVRRIQKAIQPNGSYLKSPLKKRPSTDLTHFNGDSSVQY